MSGCSEYQYSSNPKIPLPTHMPIQNKKQEPTQNQIHLEYASSKYNIPNKNINELIQKSDGKIYDQQEIIIFKAKAHEITTYVMPQNQYQSKNVCTMYLLNGMTNTGWWYQVGLEHNIIDTNKNNTYYKMIVCIFNSKGVLKVCNNFMPTSDINSRAEVLLSMTDKKGEIKMSICDIYNGASAQYTTKANGNTFIGGEESNKEGGIFTGIMNETYHMGNSRQEPERSTMYQLIFRRPTRISFKEDVLSAAILLKVMNHVAIGSILTADPSNGLNYRIVPPNKKSSNPTLNFDNSVVPIQLNIKNAQVTIGK